MTLSVQAAPAGNLDLGPWMGTQLPNLVTTYKGLHARIVTIVESESTPVTYNDPKLTARVKTILVGALGAGNAVAGAHAAYWSDRHDLSGGCAAAAVEAQGSFGHNVKSRKATRCGLPCMAASPAWISNNVPRDSAHSCSSGWYSVPTG